MTPPRIFTLFNLWLVAYPLAAVLLAEPCPSC